MAQRVCAVQKIEAGFSVLLVLEDGVWELAVETMFPLGGLDIVVTLTD